jgi:hypothetical protein
MSGGAGILPSLARIYLRFGDLPSAKALGYFRDRRVPENSPAIYGWVIHVPKQTKSRQGRKKYSFSVTPVVEILGLFFFLAHAKIDKRGTWDKMSGVGVGRWTGG